MYFIILLILLLVLLFLIKKKSNIREGFQNNNINIYYINLEKRKDRKKRIENELKKIKNIKNFNFKINRFNAIKSDIHGGIGCGKSHINILKMAKEKNLPMVMIIEDDIKINDDKINIYFEKINNTPLWDVFILSGWGKTKKYDNNLEKALGVQTTGWYIVRQHYYDKLIDVFTESVNNMENLNKNGKDINYKKWAIDQNWKKLQPNSIWFKFKNNLGLQIEDYSDIVNKKVNYNSFFNEDTRLK